MVRQQDKVRMAQGDTEGGKCNKITIRSVTREIYGAKCVRCWQVVQGMMRVVVIVNKGSKVARNSKLRGETVRCESRSWEGKIT